MGTTRTFTGEDTTFACVKILASAEGRTVPPSPTLFFLIFGHWYFFTFALYFFIFALSLLFFLLCLKTGVC